MSDVTFGVVLPPAFARGREGRFDVEGFVRVAQHAESLGYDHLLVADHVFVPDYWAKVIPDFWLDPISILSFLAGHTSRIELVASCLVVPYRQPFTTAKAIATLDQLSHGRFALGVVPGYLKEEFETFNLPLMERSEMTNEFIQIMKQLWTASPTTYHGKYYSCDEVDIQPKCVQRPLPIWVGGSSRRAIQRVAELGDVWHPLGFVPSESPRADQDELVGKELPTGGTSPKRLARGLARARELMAAGKRDAAALRAIVYPAHRVRPDDLPASRTGPLPASVAEVVEELLEYRDAGASGFISSVSAAEPEGCIEQLDAYASEVIPKLRS